MGCDREGPLYRLLSQLVGGGGAVASRVPCYAAGGYRYPTDDMNRLRDEVRGLLDLGYVDVKIKIGGDALAADVKRIEAVLSLLPSAQHLAVDAMNRYGPQESKRAARTFAPLWTVVVRGCV